jgi:hypothetical protein
VKQLASVCEGEGRRRKPASEAKGGFQVDELGSAMHIASRNDFLRISFYFASSISSSPPTASCSAVRPERSSRMSSKQLLTCTHITQPASPGILESEKFHFLGIFMEFLIWLVIPHEISELTCAKKASKLEPKRLA